MREGSGDVLPRASGLVCITFICTHSTEERVGADLPLLLGLGLLTSLGSWLLLSSEKLRAPSEHGIAVPNLLESLVALDVKLKRLPDRGVY